MSGSLKQLKRFFKWWVQLEPDPREPNNPNRWMG